ncbi:MAG: hypothetical protein MRY49_00470 [Candidatus Pacebacteria bacterium]|nr:hypothetical protein [Candidatus Paceibacterota bacterium]
MPFGKTRRTIDWRELVDNLQSVDEESVGTLDAMQELVPIRTFRTELTRTEKITILVNWISNCCTQKRIISRDERTSLQEKV